MNEKNKGTIRVDSSVISSGAMSSGTQRETGPVISSAVQSQIISAGVATGIGNKIVLNDSEYKILKTISKSTGEAEVYLVEKESQKYIFKCYYPNFKPKDTILTQLKKLNHPDIVNLLDYGYIGDRFCEVMEYAQGGSLMDIREDGRYKYIPIKDINRLKVIIKEAVNALHYCHGRGIIHRDIKPENIFFKNPDGTDVLIGDFGISSALEEGLSKRLSSQARTAIYAAPELYQSIGGKTIISKEIDYYAMGISLIHIWSGEEPFKELSEFALMGVKMNGMVDIPDDMPEELKNLIKGLITVEPSKRWGYDEVQKWLKGEYVPVHYKRVELKYKDFNFGIIDGNEMIVNSPEELARLMEHYPDKGKKHLYKGTIQNWIQPVNEALYVEIRSIVEDEYPKDEDAGLKKAIYLLDPLKGYKTFAGVECRTAEEIGDAIEAESSYYKSYLTKNKNADLYLYFEARDGKDVANAFRKYTQAYKEERAFNMMVLELQGKDRFKIDGKIFYKPEDLLLADDEIKGKIVQLLKNPDSKLSIWLEQFPYLKNNIDKWRKLNRHNNITLYYALDKNSPFVAFGEMVYSIAEFETFFAKHISDKDLLGEMATPNSEFVMEADFWLKNYQGNSYKDVLIEYLKKNIKNVDGKVCLKLLEYFMNIGMDIDEYWDKIKPLVDKANNRKILSENFIQKQKEFIIKEYENRIRLSDAAKQEKIIERLRTLEPNHKLIKRFDERVKTKQRKILFYKGVFFLTKLCLVVYTFLLIVGLSATMISAFYSFKKGNPFDALAGIGILIHLIIGVVIWTIAEKNER